MSSPRFIPAGAGNTSGDARKDFPAPVYPRWRGEHFAQKFSLKIVSGLSPLARGTPPYRKLQAVVGRFIPAGAGNTILLSRWLAPTAVYPRWRGEHDAMAANIRKIHGLSPLARGTRVSTHSPPRCQRFIPAGAGNTIIPDTS